MGRPKKIDIAIWRPGWIFRAWSGHFSNPSKCHSSCFRRVSNFFPKFEVVAFGNIFNLNIKHNLESRCWMVLRPKLDPNEFFLQSLWKRCSRSCWLDFIMKTRFFNNTIGNEPIVLIQIPCAYSVALEAGLQSCSSQLWKHPKKRSWYPNKLSWYVFCSFCFCLGNLHVSQN